MTEAEKETSELIKQFYLIGMSEKETDKFYAKVKMLTFEAIQRAEQRGRNDLKGATKDGINIGLLRASEILEADLGQKSSHPFHDDLEEVIKFYVKIIREEADNYES